MSRMRTFWHIGSQWFVYLHGGFSSPEDKRISKILLKEDVNGNYYGWLGAGDTEPTMIYPAQILVDMCFPYGPKVEEDRGRGRRIRLTCTEVVE